MNCYTVLTILVRRHREYLIDLVEKPGCLCEPDSLPNGPSTITISSPLRFPRFKQVEPTIDFRLLAKQYFLDFQSLNLIFDDSLAGDYLYNCVLLRCCFLFFPSFFW